jgi:hypothetical protein
MQELCHLLEFIPLDTGVKGADPERTQSQEHGDEGLLGAVVEVALQFAPLGVLGGDEATTRSPEFAELLLKNLYVLGQLGIQYGVVRHHACVGGQVLDQAGLDRSQGTAGWQFGS